VEGPKAGQAAAALAGVPPGVDDAAADAAADGLGVALDMTMGCAVGRGEVLLEEGERLQAESASNATATATRPKSTR